MTPGGPAHPTMFGVKTRVCAITDMHLYNLTYHGSSTNPMNEDIRKEVAFHIGSKAYRIPKGTPAYIANEGTSRVSMTFPCFGGVA